MAVERHDCPHCEAPAGSACRTRGGKTAEKYNTPRFVLVRALREELQIPVPVDASPAAPGSRVPPPARAVRPYLAQVLELALAARAQG
ncbi:zinc finger domain-containing protein [Streptomyces virginiae]|uniref:zinc finger domain-containing protein n=1 Tax=Streptomyces virginiae TaxID=1961 RepID=UPI003F54255F